MAARQAACALGAQFRRARRAIVTGKAKARFEQRDEIADDLRIAAQRVDHGHQAIGDAGLPHVAEIGAQPAGGFGAQPGCDDERVELVIFLQAEQHIGQRRFDAGLQRLPIGEHRGVADFGDEIMDPAQLAAGEIEGEFLDDAEAEIFQHRHRFGQRDDLAEAIDLQTQLARRIAFVAHQPDAAIILVVQLATARSHRRRLRRRRAGRGSWR